MHSFGDEIVQEHCAIVEAIRKRRAAEARKHTREHIENTMQRSAALWTTPGIRGFIAFDAGNANFASPEPRAPRKPLIHKPKRKRGGLHA
jgi:hypothetical protein